MEAHDYAAGYLFFLSMTFGSWNPKLIKDHVRVKLQGLFVDGKIKSDKIDLRVTRDINDILQYCPDIDKYMEDPITQNWNAPFATKRFWRTRGGRST